MNRTGRAKRAVLAVYRMAGLLKRCAVLALPSCAVLAAADLYICARRARASLGSPGLAKGLAVSRIAELLTSSTGCTGRAVLPNCGLRCAGCEPHCAGCEPHYHQLTMYTMRSFRSWPLLWATWVNFARSMLYLSTRSFPFRSTQLCVCTNSYSS